MVGAFTHVAHGIRQALEIEPLDIESPDAAAVLPGSTTDAPNGAVADAPVELDHRLEPDTTEQPASTAPQYASSSGFALPLGRRVDVEELQRTATDRATTALGADPVSRPPEVTKVTSDTPPLAPSVTKKLPRNWLSSVDDPAAVDTIRVEVAVPAVVGAATDPIAAVQDGKAPTMVRDTTGDREPDPATPGNADTGATGPVVRDPATGGTGGGDTSNAGSGRGDGGGGFGSGTIGHGDHGDGDDHPDQLRSVLARIDQTAPDAATAARAKDTVIDRYQQYRQAIQDTLYRRYLDDKTTELVAEGRSRREAEPIARRLAGEFIDSRRTRITREAADRTGTWIERNGGIAHLLGGVGASDAGAGALVGGTIRGWVASATGDDQLTPGGGQDAQPSRILDTPDLSGVPPLRDLLDVSPAEANDRTLTAALKGLERQYGPYRLSNVRGNMSCRATPTPSIGST